MNHWIKLLTALAASALVTSSAAAFALAGGASTGGAKVEIGGSKLGRILVDQRTMPAIDGYRRDVDHAFHAGRGDCAEDVLRAAHVRVPHRNTRWEVIQKCHADRSVFEVKG